MNKKLPQLRVLVTDFCDSKCIYCRPGGEGNLSCKHQQINFETAIKAAAIYKKYGGTEIKISGGDPVFWEYLSQYIRYVKHDLSFSRVEVITRSVRISDMITSLIQNGLDVLNFSLDTVHEERYRIITKKDDFKKYSDTIRSCAERIYCKINMVILPNTTEDEIEDMISFCEENHIRELKLLDYIDDLKNEMSTEGVSSSYIFDRIYKMLDVAAVSSSTAFQGGLGHPMKVFQMSDTFQIICKDARKGAWYSEMCYECLSYPCHDALMALRLTPYDSFQLCLLNDKMHWTFTPSDIEQKFVSILSLYQNANFIGSE